MKLTIKQDPSVNDTAVQLTYRQKDELVSRILRFLESVDKQLKCYLDGEEHLVNLSDIYYIESVDKKTFVYLADAVYQTDLRLYQLNADLEKYGFVQISKSCLLNIDRLASMRPLFNSRMEATLDNGEKLIVNRSYLQAVKETLRGGEDR
ncbi:LytTR family DNA-binding domain-containing protein [Streptococcus caviae]|uniref:LytTR family DNA-binding domain-containing protein n=1 Tax=Streptococcus sp. 'caviae' TaxID=1915004 RepID=UPI00094BA938|nr:LytTR family DNA-binding domain-containing protein [Streptococcus sp. 'caviae']OLN84121.1 LytTR family transcriptional regulator [Streptococcus sp. 'caviae']